MPIWLGFLVSIAVQLGMPWLLKAFPWIPASVVAEIEALVASLTKMKAAHKQSRKAAVKASKARIAGVKCT